MGREIELKIPLAKEEFDRLLRFQKEKKGSVEHLFKTDEYFSRYDDEEERRSSDEPRVIRIRYEKDQQGKNTASYFCLKYKKIENGVEFNREEESLIEKPEVLKEFLKLSGYKKYFEKKKESFGAFFDSGDNGNKGDSLHLELVNVNGHLYAEVEVTQEGPSADQVREALETFVKSLGLDISKKDSRSWMQILKSDFQS